MGGYAWVTLATNDAYSLGALVLAHSLRRVGTKYELACMVTPGVTTAMREKLAAVFSLVQEVNVLDSKDEAHLSLLARPELGITFTKLHCWRLTQYEKCVFVDADALVVRNCDELFEREELSAAPDVGWPDCFNSGVFVYRPSQQTFASIVSFAAAKGSFDGGDQGLLNMYFSDWATKDISKHLPFIYNMCSTATYSYLPAFKQFGEDVRIIHFIGITKPWLQYFDTLTGVVQPPAGSGHLQPLLQLWWNIFCELVHPQLSTSMVATRISGLLLPDISPKPYTPAPFVPSDVNHNAYNDVSQQAPDFSEFKDPWEDRPHCGALDQSFNASVVNEHNFHEADVSWSSQTSSHSCWKEESVSRRADHDERQFELNRHDRTVHNEYRQYAIPHAEDNCSQHSAPHTTYHHWQCGEQRHDVQRQHHHEPHRDEERRPSEQHSGQFQRDDCHKTNDETAHYSTRHQQVHEHYAHEWRSIRVIHESHAQHHASDNNQASHRNVDHHQFHAQRTPESIQSASNERSLEAADKRTDEPRIDSRPLPSAPNSDLHNIATQTDPSAANHTGIAGALAQLTLGAARSEQQIALEEQMRKQSWEQGHIDYMGQDSFDNIWKKICETLSQAQQRQASPPKEDKPKDEETTSVPVAPAVQPAAIVEPKTPTVETDSTQEQPLVRKLSEEKLPAVPAETPAAQPSEQKTTVLPAEESITVETAATRVSSEPAQSAPEEDGGVKPPTQESQDVKPCETCTEVPSPRPPVELPSSAKTIAEQCEHASAQEAASREKSENAESPTPSAEPRAPTAICKPAVSEPATPVVAQGETAPASADDKAQVSAPVTPSCATQPAIIGAAADTQDMIAPAVTPNEGSIRDTAEPRGATDVTQPLTIDPSERRAEMLLTASEISTVSPVPIQVAESVLQTEPKESVSDSAASVSDQAIAATVTAITNVAPTTAVEQAVRLNGLACDSGKRDDVAVPSPAPTEEPASDSVMEKAAAPLPAAEEKVEPISSSVLSAEKPAEQVEEATKPTEQVPTEAAPTAQIATSEAKETKSPEQQVATTEVTGAKPAEQIAKATTAEEKASEQPEKIEITGAIVQSEATAKIETAGTESTEQAPEAQVSESPTESVEAKAINVPSTPTVTEATPPTSPSVESAQETAESQEKAAKKSLKKSDSADGTDGEGSDKKAAVKKTVKKVTKKPKPPKSEEAVSAVPEAALTGDNSQSKTKKTVKVTKKTGAKSLEADTTVPETPPPLTTATTTTTSSAAAATAAVAAAVAATPDVPVPPRRKTKAATTSAKGTASKKPEAEE